jgi:sugar lactone lactonase YvrE
MLRLALQVRPVSTATTPGTMRVRQRAGVRPGFLRPALCLTLLLLSVAALAVPVANAQPAAAFAGAQSIVPLGFGISPKSVAIDASGNVYVADTANNQVIEAGWAGTTFALNTVAGSANGLSCPSGVAVDSAGNVYISDSCAMQVLKETQGAGSYIQSIVASQAANSLNTPAGVAVDGAGNVYIADQNNRRVLKETPSGNGYMQNVVASGLMGPRSVAVDASGNLYVADANSASTSSQVLKETLTSGAYAQSVIAATSTNGLGLAAAVTVDASGNVYIADSGNGQVLKETPNTAGYTATIVAGKAANGLASPSAIAVDSNGNIYIADNGNGDVVEVQPQVADFGTVPITNRGWNDLLTYVFNSATVLNSTAPYRIVAMGAPGQEFSDAGSGTCAAGTAYAAGSSCTVSVVFAPRFAGARSGAVTLQDSNGNTIATALLTGAGDGPQLIHFAGFPSVAATQLGMASDVAADSAGTIYVADEGAPWLNAPPAVYKIAPATNAQVALGSGWQIPTGVALDGAGNVYVSDYGLAAVFKISPNGTQTKLPLALQGPIGLAVDKAGNLFVADSAGAAVYELTSGGNVSEIGAGWIAPDYLAVDSAGNLYVSDFASGVFEVRAGGAQNLLSGAIQYPEGIAVDAAGTVYVAGGSNSNQVIYELAASGQAIPLLTQADMPYPLGLALDMSGNLYIADSNAGEYLSSAEVVEFDRGDPLPALNFPTPAPAGSADETDGPRTAVFQNVGNEPVLLALPDTGSNPSYPENFPLNASDSNLCTPAQPLAPGATCDVSMTFAPVEAGSISGMAILITNSLNQAAATQSVAAAGTSVGTPQTISFVPPTSSVAFGNAPIALSATATSGLPVAFTILSGPGNLNGNLLTVTGTGTISLSASQTGGGVYAAASPVTQSITVTKAAQAITITPIKSPVTYGAKPIDLSATATSGLPVAFKVVSGPGKLEGSMLTVTGAGTVDLAATQPGDANHQPAPSASYSIAVEKAVVTVTANNQSIRQGLSLPKLTYKVSGLVSGDTLKSSLTGQPKLTTTADPKPKPGKYAIAVSAGTLAAKNYLLTYEDGSLIVTR